MFFLLQLVSMIVLFSCFRVSCAKAEFRIGWENQVDIADLVHMDKKHQQVGRESIVWRKYDNDLGALHDLSIQKVDAVSVDMVSLLSVVTIGLQARVVAIDRQYGAENALFVRNESHIEGPKDLIGKTIAVPFMTSSHYSLLRYLQHVHIPVDQVKIMNMQTDRIVQAWRDGSIDGTYVEGFPGLQFAKDGHSLVNSAQLAEWGYPTYQVWVVMDETVADQPSLMQDFVDRNLKEIHEFRQKQAQLTLQSPEVMEISQLVNIPPESVLALLKMQTYPMQSQQALILSHHLPGTFNQMALFLRSQKAMPDILFDYLLYVYESFIVSSKVKSVP